MKNQAELITEEGLDSLIQDLHNGAYCDIKEVDELLKKYYKIIEGDNKEAELQVLGESINNLLRNKYQARDQLFKVANLIKDRIKKKSFDDTEGLEKVFDINEIVAFVNKNKS